MRAFDPDILTTGDRILAVRLLGSLSRLETPDLIIAPDGRPYLYRWWLAPRLRRAEVYFHIQTASDPERPPHDHPYDNQSVILAGGYHEVMRELTPTGAVLKSYIRRPGDVIQRKAEDAHRLILPCAIPYTMTLFTTGPARRAWGFWHGDRWLPETDVVATVDGVSIWKEPESCPTP